MNSGTFAEIAEIGGIKYKGSVQFYVSGKLAYATLFEPTRINGLLFRDVLTFDREGFLLRGNLAEPTERYGAHFKAQLVSLFRDGTIENGVIDRSTLPITEKRSCDFSSEWAVGHSLHAREAQFFDGGKIQSGILVSDCRIWSPDGRSYYDFDPGYWVELNESGRLLKQEKLGIQLPGLAD
ncbi:MAG: hypothetical protein HY074_14755 [Deltaproteobacteria bacterium]|nr:hypothetical protein [Deltaproteobacteria bacterium]